MARSPRGRSQFQRRCFLHCLLSPEAPKAPEGLCRTLPSPRQRGDGRGGEMASKEVSPRPSGFTASDLGPPRTSPVGIWSVCPGLGLSVDGVPPGSRVVGSAWRGFRVAPPGQEAAPAPAHLCVAAASHRPTAAVRLGSAARCLSADVPAPSVHRRPRARLASAARGHLRPFLFYQRCRRWGRAVAAVAETLLSFNVSGVLRVLNPVA